MATEYHAVIATPPFCLAFAPRRAGCWAFILLWSVWGRVHIIAAQRAAAYGGARLNGGWIRTAFTRWATGLPLHFVRLPRPCSAVLDQRRFTYIRTMLRIAFHKPTRPCGRLGIVVLPCGCASRRLWTTDKSFISPSRRTLHHDHHGRARDAWSQGCV